MPRALLSVSDKTGLLPFAQALAGRGYELVSTGGTARALETAGVPVTGISAVTGFPEIMDGRVKTLHPAVHGGILARRGRTDDMATLGQHNITPIDIVVVNLYPFVKTAATPDIAFGALGRGNRHRRAQHGALGREEFPGRAGRRRSGGLSARARRARAARRAVERVPLRARAKGVRAHGGLRHRDRRNARRNSTPPRGASRARPTRRSTPAAAVADPAQDQGAALRGESASAGGVVCGRQRLRAWARRRCCRARSCRSPTCSISIRPRASRSSSPSRPRPSSSTRIRAERRSASRSRRRTFARARPIRWRRSAASSGSTARSTPRRRGRSCRPSSKR